MLLCKVIFTKLWLTRSFPLNQLTWPTLLHNLFDISFHRGPFTSIMLLWLIALCRLTFPRCVCFYNTARNLLFLTALSDVICAKAEAERTLGVNDLKGRHGLLDRSFNPVTLSRRQTVCYRSFHYVSQLQIALKVTRTRPIRGGGNPPVSGSTTSSPL